MPKTPVAGLRALLATATQLPWRLTKVGPEDWEIVGANAHRVLWHPKGGLANGSGLITGDEINKADAALIVEAVSALPGLLNELTQLRALVKYLDPEGVARQAYKEERNG